MGPAAGPAAATTLALVVAAAAVAAAFARDEVAPPNFQVLVVAAVAVVGGALTKRWEHEMDQVGADEPAAGASEEAADVAMEEVVGMAPACHQSSAWRGHSSACPSNQHCQSHKCPVHEQNSSCSKILLGRKSCMGPGLCGMQASIPRRDAARASFDMQHTRPLFAGPHVT